MYLLSIPRAAAAGAALLVLCYAGCDTMSLPLESTSRVRPPDSTTDPETPPAQDLVVENDDSNNVFENAQPATLAIGGVIQVEGRINGVGDVDLFRLGPVLAGDRITIDVTGFGGLNTVAALFDAGGNLIDANDDRSYYGGQLDPFLARQIRADTDNLYVGVAVSSADLFASGEGRYESGDYSIKIRHAPDSFIAPPRTQVVYMDFEGGSSVQIGFEPIVNMKPFSVEAITGRLNGQTDYIIDVVLQKMAIDFAEYDVVLLNSREHAKPSEAHSVLFFGNYDSRFLGLADNVDTGNASLQQEAIIYTETLALFESLRPSAFEIGQAVANVAGHELGHLLGLEHTSEAFDLMATAASARQVLETDATVARALLNSGVFPIGWQNAPTTLMQNVGPTRYPNARIRISDDPPIVDRSFRDHIDPASIPQVPMCGRCAGAR